MLTVLRQLIAVHLTDRDDAYILGRFLHFLSGVKSFMHFL